MKNYTNRMVWILVGLFGLFWDDRSQVLLVGMRGLGGEREKLGGLLFFDLTPNLYELNWGYTFLVLISPLIQSFHLCIGHTRRSDWPMFNWWSSFNGLLSHAPHWLDDKYQLTKMNQ